MLLTRVANPSLAECSTSPTLKLDELIVDSGSKGDDASASSDWWMTCLLVNFGGDRRVECFSETS